VADLEVEILAGAAFWQGREGIISRALAAAAQAEGKSGAVSVFLADDAAVAQLNQQFRGKAGPTNVLSFPPPPGHQAEPGFLGDIALAAETIVEQANFQGKPVENHAAHLAVHGFLHLIGYDHENPADAEAMEARERAILASIGIDDPYA
jgi:probable rRNA maturation factor